MPVGVSRDAPGGGDAGVLGGMRGGVSIVGLCCVCIYMHTVGREGCTCVCLYACQGCKTDRKNYITRYFLPLVALGVGEFEKENFNKQNK